MSYGCDSFTSRDFLTSHMGVSSDVVSGHMHPLSTIPLFVKGGVTAGVPAHWGKQHPLVVIQGLYTIACTVLGPLMLGLLQAGALMF